MNTFENVNEVEVILEETVAKKAFRLLSPLDPDSFTTNQFTNGVDKCCVVGHYQRLKSPDPSDYSPENCWDYHASDLRNRSIEFLNIYPGYSIADVNNSTTGKYQQETPYERSMAVLTDMIEAGY